MNYRVAAIALVCALALTGCSTLLNREYSFVTKYSATPTADGDSTTLRVESYQELVNAVLYLVTQREVHGCLRLYNYDQAKVADDVNAACLEVVQEDPLGAYSVDYIRSDISTIVSYYEVDLEITYRRTQEQIASIVAATGASAIRTGLQQALASFSPEVVLRISYFEEDDAYISNLVREAYYSNPSSALGQPQAQIYLYPQQGQQRIVEVLLSYPLDRDTLLDRQQALQNKARELLGDLWYDAQDVPLEELAQMILAQGGYTPDGGDTAYDVLLGNGGNSRGLALAFALLCQENGQDFQIVEGEKNGSAHCWTVVQTENGYRHFDLTRVVQGEAAVQAGPAGQEYSLFLTDGEVEALGYVWNTSETPLCG